jgi:pimeloyl-ACP methyl ester carboxylesterase
VSITSDSGSVTVYVDGAGPPLLLIHSINAAASAAEVLPLQKHFRASRRVFCLDLPGFGLSERRDLPYLPSHMTDALHRSVDLIRRLCGPAPIDALALSLSCEYLARAVSEQPAAFRSVALVSPTGFSGRRARRGPPGSTRGIAWLYGLLRGPGWGRALYRQLTRPAVIRYFLERTWGSKQIDEDLWRYDILTAQMPGAEFAPLRFLSAYLFSADIHVIYEALRLPVWMCHGVRGDFTDYRNRQFLAERRNWTFTVFPSGALPHFEIPHEFCAEYERFLAAVASESPAAGAFEPPAAGASESPAAGASEAP